LRDFLIINSNSLSSRGKYTISPGLKRLLKSVDGLILTSPLIPCVFIIVPIIYMCASPILLIFYLYDNIVFNNNELFFRYLFPFIANCNIYLTIKLLFNNFTIKFQNI